jgi:hypothetical protein
MIQDPSAILFDRYFNLSNRQVSVYLLNGAVHRGVFVGFFHGDEDDKFAILRWHLMPEGEHAPLGIGAGGERKGMMIDSAHIARVELHGDQSTIPFQ